jgi:hypothetical protein
VLFVQGTTRNQALFYPRFDHIVLLSALPEILAERLASRTTNPYGKDPAELAETLQYQQTMEPLPRISLAPLSVSRVKTATPASDQASTLRHPDQRQDTDQSPAFVSHIPDQASSADCPTAVLPSCHGRSQEALYLDAP